MPRRSGGAFLAAIIVLASTVPPVGGGAVRLPHAEQVALLDAEAARKQADVVLHGWRFAPVDTVIAHAPSPRACEPRWVDRTSSDLDFTFPLPSGVESVLGPAISACPDVTMSASYTLGLATAYGEGSIDVARLRWDRPAFPVDASARRVRALRVNGAPAVLVAPLDERTGFGPSQLIVIKGGVFGPYADLLVLSGSNVTASTLIDLAEQVRPGVRAVKRLPDVLDLIDDDDEPVRSTLKILPPAAHGSGTVRAKVTDDWHCSRVSGDSCPDGRTRSCRPGDHGRSSCSALDWNRGSPVIGENVYVRALGVATPAARVVQARPTSSMQTCHVVQVQIVDDGTAIGSLRYQHISRRAKAFDVALGAGEETLTEKMLGETINEARLAPGCPWSGSHVHEDDTTAKAWVAWNEKRYTNRDRARFDVHDPANWTRMLSWTREQ